jgi:NTP pyrophosphatase (non-canonical NTP hydrolase)
VAKKEDTPHLLNQLRDQCARDSMNWFPEAMSLQGEEGEKEHHLIHHTLSLCGEAGELANLVKKVDRGTLKLDAEIVQFDLADELTDVFIYVLNVAALLRVDLLHHYIAKRNKNIERFGKKAS